MISDPARLREVTEEIADWPLERRRAYISEIETAFGTHAASQIKQALQALWTERK
jgi:hypothetical protein